MRPVLLAVFLMFNEAEASPQNLKDIFAHARQKNLELNSLQWNKKIAELEALKVKASFAPSIRSLAGVGPVTEIRGDALTSTSDTSKYGVAFRGEVELTWPVWTWGRKDDYLAAVREGALVQSLEVEEKWLEIRYRIREAYYGYLLAKTLKDFVDDGIAKVEEAVAGISSRQKDRRSKMTILLAEAKQKQVEINTGLKLSRAGLRVFGGYEQDVTPPTNEWLKHQRRELQPLEHYTRNYGEHPKFKKIEAGLKAKNSLKRAEEKARYPVVGILAKYSYANSPVHENQRSSFAYDPFNHSEAAGGVGFKWDLQWGEATAKSKKLSAEIAKLEAQRTFAKVGLSGLIEKAWLEVNQAESKVRLAKKAQKAGKKWLNRKAIGSGTGLARGDGLVDAFLARAKTKTEFLEAVYQLELAWARLEKAVGAPTDL